MAKARTIQIFLPDGNPRGVKIAEITSRTIQAVFIPRASVSFAVSRNELNNVGVYFLVGESEDNGKPLVYVGETENCADRLRDHHKKKDFWQYGLMMVSQTKSFTKACVKYLEWYCHQQAQKAGRFALENSSQPKEAHVSESRVADLLDNFDDIKILVSTLGYKIFDAIEKPTDENVLYCKVKGAVGTGEYTEDGFTVFKGSTCNLEPTKSCASAIKKKRELLYSNGVLVEKDGYLVFTEDSTFGSPSTAACVIIGRNTNGWTAWKYKNGKTLDEVERQS